MEEERELVEKNRQLRRKRIKEKRTRELHIKSFLCFLLLGAILLGGYYWYSCSGKEKEEPKVPENVPVEEETAQGTEEQTYTEPEVQLLMVGDMLLHDPVLESGRREDGSYNYDHLFTHVKEEIQEADIAIANQEVILGGAEMGLSGYPNFNAPFEVGDALAEAGFDVVLHATNHTMDRGKEAVLNCLNYWKTEQSEVAALGIFDSQEAYDNEIYVQEKDGIKIAILNYTYGTNGMPIPEDMPYAVAMLEEEKVLADLQKANELADFVVVCPHWGTEYMHEQSEEQDNWTTLFLENGVDLILGTHTHTIQPAKMLTGENGEEMLVYYSLGNFVNATAESGTGTADRMVGAMAKITISRRENGEVYIKEYGVEPLVTQLLYGPQEITTYKLTDYTEELAAENKILEKDDRFSLDFCWNLSREVFGDLIP